MILFSCLKKEFIEAINYGVISNRVYYAYKQKMGKKTKLSQIKSWANSLPFMKDILIDLPDDVGITIEYGIPLTSKMVDVIISGYDENKKPVIILVELKQWEYVYDVRDRDAVVKTLIGSKEINSLHPSYQVLSYKELMQNYNVNIDINKVNIIPLVYLHNYDLRSDDDILNKKFAPYYKKALMFGKNDIDELKSYIHDNIKFGDNLEVMQMIDNSEIKPTKKLLDVIGNVLETKKEFLLLDEQKVIMEEISKYAYMSFTDNKKRVMIIKGGPGTGKSVLAINALGELLSIGLMGAYVSKNMAPRAVYKTMVLNGDKKISINELFKGSGFFFRDKCNKYDFLLIDEAHRLQEKSGLHNNIGENQIKEIINAARLSVFFVDEKQIVTLKDIGRIANIKDWAKFYEALVIEMELNSQFRCNGSDNYLDFIDKLLYNKREKNSFNFDFQVMDSPHDLRKLIIDKNTNNNARLVAGYCWTRNGKNADNQDYLDIKIDDFGMSWNLKHGEPFAIRENAINEIGCIHNVQGLEFDYIGVIIGPDLKYREGKIITDCKERASTEKSLYGLYVLMKKDKTYYQNLADTIIRNTYRVLLTRGIKGCYVYSVDKELQKYLKKIIKEKRN
ncbi:MAG: DUF2075 domain-containing protein [Bacilli bacterium]|nr:DUF2075 domain-containing protein [Bacilli bacterium]